MASRWHYDPLVSGRDLRLDFLRGLCVIKMIFNHLWPTPLHQLQSWIGYVTGAEGFFFISGVVVGIVHGRRARQHGLAAASGRVLQRSLNLYIANLALVFLFLSLEYAGYLSQSFGYLEAGEHLWQWVFIFNQPHLLHVLPRYVIFLAATPLALWCLTRRRTPWLLVSSSTLFLLNLTAEGELYIPWLESRGYVVFPILSWQLLFFTGISLGYHRDRIGQWYARQRRGRWLGILALLSLIFVLVKQGQSPRAFAEAAPVLVSLLERSVLGPLRLINLAVFFGFSFLVTDLCWRPIARWLGPIVLPFGQHALYAFLVHILVASFGRPALALLPSVLQGSWPSLALNLCMIGMMWLMLRKRFLFGFVPN